MTKIKKEGIWVEAVESERLTRCARDADTLHLLWHKQAKEIEDKYPIELALARERAAIMQNVRDFILALTQGREVRLQTCKTFFANPIEPCTPHL